MCFRLNEFSGLLQIAFGLNLALPILRELTIIPRAPIMRQLNAVESLVGLRKYAGAQSSSALTARIQAVRREIVIEDDKLRMWINCGAAFTFLFAISALYWSFYAAMDQSCLGTGLSFFITAIHFAPLPIAISVIYARSCATYNQIAVKVARIKDDALSVTAAE